MQLLVNQTTKTVWFFNLRDGQWLPTMQTLHQCAHSRQPHPHPQPFARSSLTAALARARSSVPDALPKVRVDRGAIKFVLAGASPACAVPSHVAPRG